MMWVERVKGYFKADVLRRFMVTALALSSSASAAISAARAATAGFIDEMPGRVVPMYGVPVTIRPPIVKYGPPPVPTATVSPAGPCPPDFGWFPSWSFSDKLPISFTAPDFGHLIQPFPKLLAFLAFVAYVSLFLAAICGLALSGSRWYLKNKGKK